MMVFVSKKYFNYFWENEIKTFHVNVLLQSGANIEFADQIRHMHKQTFRKPCLIRESCNYKSATIIFHENFILFYEKSLSLKC